MHYQKMQSAIASRGELMAYIQPTLDSQELKAKSRRYYFTNIKVISAWDKDSGRGLWKARM